MSNSMDGVRPSYLITLNQRVQGSSPCAPTIEAKQYQILKLRRSLKTGVPCRRVTIL